MLSNTFENENRLRTIIINAKTRVNNIMLKNKSYNLYDQQNI